MAEGTRLHEANEIDLTIKFQRMYEDGQEFEVAAEDGFHLLVPRGNKLIGQDGKFVALEEQRPKMVSDKKVFDHIAFLAEFMESISKALRHIRSSQHWPQGLDFSSDWDRNKCLDCRCILTSTVYYPYSHCKMCRPVVTHSKIGPCLIFTWNKDFNEQQHQASKGTDEHDDMDGKLEVLTVDIIPVYPVKSPAGLMGLFNTSTRSLLRK